MSAKSTGRIPAALLSAASRYKSILFFVLGFFFVGIHSAEAQQSSGIDTLRIAEDPQLAQGEIIASRDENRDANGRLAAGLFIRTDLTGLTFQANNGVIKRVDQPGEYRLFLSPDERRVTIYKEGFSPFQLVLSDEGIRLNSGQVWTIGITGDKKIPEISVNFLFTPSTIKPELRIDGAFQESYEGIPLAVGEHVVQIQAGGFDSITDTITVSESNSLFRYELERVAPQLISITTNPSGAQVTLDEEVLGQTPVEKIFKSPGQYMLEVSRQGFLTVTEQIIVQRTDTPTNVQTFNINLPKNTATIILDVTPSDARVELNGSAANHSRPIDFPGGDLLMEVSAQGFRTYTENFNAARGDTIRKTVNLEEVFGSLQFAVKPLDADVTLRRGSEVVETWRGPNYLAELRTGTYTVQATSADYLEETEEFTITEGELTDISFEMRPKDGISRLSIKGIPGPSKVSVTGLYGSASAEELPLDEQSLRFGEYDIVVRKKGFKRIEEQITLNETSETVHLLDQYEPKSKGTAVAMMLLIPGGGQFYMGKGGRGLLYLAASGAAIGYAISAYGTLQSDIDAYQEALFSYENANGNFDQRWAEVESSFQTKEDSKQQVIIGLGAFLGVRVIELFDNLLTASPQKKLEKARLNLNTGGRSVSLRYNF